MSTCTYMYAQNTPLSFYQSLLVENQNLMKIHKYFLKIQNCVLQKNLRWSLKYYESRGMIFIEQK